MKRDTMHLLNLPLFFRRFSTKNTRGRDVPFFFNTDQGCMNGRPRSHGISQHWQRFSRSPAAMGFMHRWHPGGGPKAGDTGDIGVRGRLTGVTNTLRLSAFVPCCAWLASKVLVLAASANSAALSRASSIELGIIHVSLPVSLDILREFRIFVHSRRCLTHDRRYPLSPIAFRSSRILVIGGIHALSSIRGSSDTRAGLRLAQLTLTSRPRPSVILDPSPGIVSPPSSSLEYSFTVTSGMKVTRRLLRRRHRTRL